MTKEQAKEYLRRIGAGFSETASAEYLSELQYAHLLAVPYENLDILRQKRISLSEDSLYEKIVLKRRGGYCFELNRLFGILLRTLGFQVTDYVARYLRDADGIPKRRHQVLRVRTADKKEFLCDVGVGAAIPLRPVPYVFGQDSVQENGIYSLRADPVYGVVLTEVHGGGRRDVYGFTEEIQLAPDFDFASFWCEFAPDSPFNKKPILSIRRPGKRITLDGDVFREFSASGVCEKVLTPDEADAAAAEVFGIRL